MLPARLFSSLANSAENYCIKNGFTIIFDSYPPISSSTNRIEMKKRYSIFLFFLWAFMSDTATAQLSYADSMQRKIATQKNDSTKALDALKLAFHYIFNDSAQSKKYINMALRISLEKNIRYAEVNAYNVNGIFYDIQGMSDSALYYFQKGLEVNKQYGFADMDVRLLNNLGMYSWNKGFLTQAQTYFFEAIDKNSLVTDTGKRQDESAMLSNIGLIYQEQTLYEKALEYHYKALTLRRARKLNRYIPISLNNIGICCSHLDSIDKAITVYKEGIELARTIDDKRTLLDLYDNLAAAYLIKQAYAAALNLYREIIDGKDKFKIQDKVLMNVEAKTAGCYLLLHDVPKAWVHMNRALDMLQQQPELKHYANSVYSFASALYYQDNQPEKGFAYSMMGQELSDENAKEESLRKTTELEVQYETKKKEATIAGQQLRIAKDQRAIAQRNVGLILISSVALLAFGGFYLLYSRRKIKAEKEEEQKINSAIFESEQKERIRIARDLHDSIGQKLSVIKMLLSQHTPDEHTIKAVNYLDETVTEVRNISHNLIPEILHFGLVNAIESLADTLNSTEDIHIDLAVDEATQQLKLPRQTELSIYRIIQEIFANILKHAHTKYVAIEMKTFADHLQIDIQDRGIGFPASAIEQSQGIGWKNIFARIRLINGSLKVASDKNNGSQFFINIPLV